MAQVINLHAPSKEKESQGIWKTLRLLALTRNSCFRDVVSAVLTNYFCGECREHGIQFVRNNPIPPNSNDWFTWMVKWQNDVNRRTKKRTYSLSEALELMRNYSDKDGPGMWWIMRMLAETKNTCFIEVVNVILDNYSYKDYNRHALHFVEANPIPGNRNDWFSWMVRWQNDVNRRTGKHIYTLEQARAVMNSHKDQFTPQQTQKTPLYWGQTPVTEQSYNIVNCSDCSVTKPAQKPAKPSYQSWFW